MKTIVISKQKTGIPIQYQSCYVFVVLMFPDVKDMKLLCNYHILLLLYVLYKYSVSI